MADLFRFHPKEREIPPKLVKDIPKIIKKMYTTNKRLLLAFGLGYFTGARVSEIVSLRLDDFNWKNNLSG